MGLADSPSGTSGSGRIEVEPLETEEEFVTVRPIPGQADDIRREVRVSCPDAVGLGCDIARLLFDFGLRILAGDVSTDGKWSFCVFKVRLSRNVRPHWALLKARLRKICPVGGAAIAPWASQPVAWAFGDAFLLSVSSYDRSGVLHDLMNGLWEADLAVFKAHITTGPGGRVADMFWVHDYRKELPEEHRVLQIKELVRGCLRQRDVECTIEPAPPQGATSREAAGSEMAQRCACSDASSFSPLRRLLSRRRREKGAGGGVVITQQADELGAPEQMQVSIDNCTSPAYSVLGVVCADRKGLVYDLMRTMKDMHIRVAYAKVAVRPGGLCGAELFVNEVGGSQIVDEELQEELTERVRLTMALPVRIDVRDAAEGSCTELLVTAFLDSGGRGRPRVTYDVTAALTSLGLCVFMADVYIDVLNKEFQRPVELHRFLIHRPDGGRLEGTAARRELYNKVRAQLMGTDEAAADARADAARRGSTAEAVLDALAAWNWRS